MTSQTIRIVIVVLLAGVFALFMRYGTYRVPHGVSAVRHTTFGAADNSPTIHANKLILRIPILHRVTLIPTTPQILPFKKDPPTCELAESTSPSRSYNGLLVYRLHATPDDPTFINRHASFPTRDMVRTWLLSAVSESCKSIARQLTDTYSPPSATDLATKVLRDLQSQINHDTNGVTLSQLSLYPAHPFLPPNNTQDQFNAILAKYETQLANEKQRWESYLTTTYRQPIKSIQEKRLRSSQSTQNKAKQYYALKEREAALLVQKAQVTGYAKMLETLDPTAAQNFIALQMIELFKRFDRASTSKNTVLANTPSPNLSDLQEMLKLLGDDQ